MKYIIDAWGLEKYLDECEKHLDFPFRRVSEDDFIARADIDRFAHVGFHQQKQRICIMSASFCPWVTIVSTA